MKKIKLELSGPPGAGKTLLLKAVKTWLNDLNISYDDGGENDISIILSDDDLQFLSGAY